MVETGCDFLCLAFLTVRSPLRDPMFKNSTNTAKEIIIKTTAIMAKSEFHLKQERLKEISNKKKLIKHSIFVNLT